MKFQRKYKKIWDNLRQSDNDFTHLVSDDCVWWGAAMQPLTGGEDGVVIGDILLVLVRCVLSTNNQVVSLMSWLYLQSWSAVDCLCVSAQSRSHSQVRSTRLSYPTPPPMAGNMSPGGRGMTESGSFRDSVRYLLDIFCNRLRVNTMHGENCNRSINNTFPLTF